MTGQNACMRGNGTCKTLLLQPWTYLAVVLQATAFLLEWSGKKVVLVLLLVVMIQEAYQNHDLDSSDPC